MVTHTCELLVLLKSRYCFFDRPSHWCLAINRTLFVYLFVFCRICESLGLSPFDLSPKEIDRLDQALRNIQESTTVLKNSELCTSPGRKISSTIYDMTEYLAQSPPPSPSISEPDSPRSSLSSSSGLLSGYSRQLSDSQSDSSETESDQSDVFTENEVSYFLG